LERPIALGLQQNYTEQQARVLVDRALKDDEIRVAPLDPNRAAPEIGGTIDQQADGNFEIMPTEIAQVNGEYRTSLLIDPPNGRLPFKGPPNDIYTQWRAQGLTRTDGPEFRGVLERCLNPGAQLPLLTIFPGGADGGNPGGDNPVRNVQIVQNKDYVIILSEYFSLVRIVRLNSEHLTDQGRKWMGDSIAYYDNDSLVIHTNGFRPEQSGLLRSSDQFEITETYTPISNDEILFRYTITDPGIYSRPFTVEIPLKRMAEGQQIYEYACHEGNYSMSSILKAARITGL